QIMKLESHIPQKCLSLLECLELRAREYAVIDQFIGVAGVIKIFPDPVERLQVAQSAFAVLDIRLNQISAFALSHMASVPLRQLGLHELQLASGHDLLPEARLQLDKKVFVAAKRARFEQRGRYGG